MKIGIISDTHDNAERVEKALKIFRDNQVGLLIHCGDMTNMETALLFQNIPTHAVLGNCDMNEQAISSAIAVSGGQFHGLSGQLLIDNLQIAWTHGHDKKLLHHLENLDKWDFVFYGHTHIARIEQRGKTTIINPGAIQRVTVPTIGVLDCKTKQYQSITVE